MITRPIITHPLSHTSTITPLSGLIERETEVKLLLLAVLCREHVLLLGPPGTGKSELGRRLASICGMENLLDPMTYNH